MRAWWRLTEGSVRVAALAAEAGMQAGQWRLGYCSDRNWWDLGQGGNGSQKAQGTAAAETLGLRASLGGGECEVAF